MRCLGCCPLKLSCQRRRILPVTGCMGVTVQLLLCRVPCQRPVDHMCALQVPRSSKQVAEDNDYTLFSVTLFRRVVDTFKSTARTRGFQVGTLGRVLTATAAGQQEEVCWAMSVCPAQDQLSLLLQARCTHSQPIGGSMCLTCCTWS